MAETLVVWVWRTYKCLYCGKIYLARTQPTCLECMEPMLPCRIIFPKPKATKNDFENPVGTFQCNSCREVFDGQQLLFNPKLHVMGGWVCVKENCDGEVRRISDQPLTKLFDFAPGKSY